MRNELLDVGVLAKMTDDVDLPALGAVAQVGRVDRRLLVHVLRKTLAQVVEVLGRRVGGHGLRQELVAHLRVEQRLDLGVCIGPHRQRGLHHDAGVLPGLVAGILLQQVVGHVERCGQPDQEHEYQDEIELQ
jgi:hypothetical protein